ncbi:hypothetical protein [Mycobacterium sp. E3198]|uniref:hypothetical protein n=1 Tax=Mycobacterium sp. E3198 TaxID=1834143 RepID=UPI0012E9B982|nr:hypothetical protein [Mycobacterium sp. E3198]
MSALSPSPRWRPLPSSPLVDALREDEEIEDVVALSGAEVPEWVQRLSLPVNWELLELPDVPDQAICRMAVCGPRGNGEWDAADTISLFGYTGWPTFYDVLHNADGTLRALNGTEIAVQVLPVPPIQWTAAVRSSGVALIGERSVWVQVTNYVAGSEQPHAGRLIVHSVYLDTPSRARLAEDVTQLSDAVYQGFVAALLNQTGAV